MSIFDNKANKILTSLLKEGSTDGIQVTKIRLPGGEKVDINVKYINTDSGEVCIADEDVDNIKKGDDVTEYIISSEDEEFDFVKADLDKDGKISSYEKKRGEAVARAKEEDAEDPEMKNLGLGDDAIAAVTIAGRLASKASGGFLGKDPQKVMNTAYGTLMKKIANKITVISNNIT